MNHWYRQVAWRARHRCEYCHAPELVFNLSFEVEHIVPLSRNGADAESNMALACRSCNVHKGANLDFADPETGKLARLFNPRRDKWDQHFDVDIATGVIVGLTPVVRATLVCLHMNSDSAQWARQQWIRLGVFP